MTIRRMSYLTVLLSFCAVVLCVCGGCLDTSTPVSVPEQVGSVSISVPTEGYGLFMSSTVGILLQPVPEGTEAGNFSYDWQCDGGQFLTWGASDYIVTEHGTSLLQDQPTPVYWNPLGEDGDITSVEESSPATVTLQVYDSDGVLVAEAAPVTIQRKDDGLWYAK